jgi:hypothetical protein
MEFHNWRALVAVAHAPCRKLCTAAVKKQRPPPPPPPCTKVLWCVRSDAAAAAATHAARVLMRRIEQVAGREAQWGGCIDLLAAEPASRARGAHRDARSTSMCFKASQPGRALPGARACRCNRQLGADFQPPLSKAGRPQQHEASPGAASPLHCPTRCSLQVLPAGSGHDWRVRRQAVTQVREALGLGSVVPRGAVRFVVWGARPTARGRTPQSEAVRSVACVAGVHAECARVLPTRTARSPLW